MTTWEETGPEVLICHHHVDIDSQTTSLTPFKIAAFDLDSTLIKSKSGICKTEDPEDWIWWHPTVPDKLRGAVNDGVRIVIITNQGRLTLRDGSASPAQNLFRSKIELILQALNLPITLYAACANDNWRKPRTKAWEHYLHKLKQGNEIDTGESFLVGDAAGRLGDHDDADRHFCENAMIKFFTPEQWFLGGAKEEYINKLDTRRYLRPHSSARAVLPNTSCQDPSTLCLLIGPPGAGKTKFYFDIMEPLGYKRIDLSSPGSMEVKRGCVRAHLSHDSSVVLDDCHLSRESRANWVLFARKHGISIVALHLTTPPELCLHNDAFRALGMTEYDSEHRPIYPRTVFWKLISTFEEPSREEGFQDVVKIDFEWRGTDETRTTWQKFWI